MAFPKNDLFPVFDQRVSKFARALGHPARIRILRLLEENGSMQVIQLEDLLPLSQGTITEHLRKLRLAELINVTVRGLMNFYSINESGIQSLFNTHLILADILYGAYRDQSGTLIKPGSTAEDGR